MSNLLSLYWPLPSFLEVPHRWVSQLAYEEDGQLSQWSGHADDTRSDQQLTPSFLAQATFSHVPRANTALQLAFDLATATGLPHTQTDFVGGPTWEGVVFRDESTSEPSAYGGPADGEGGPVPPASRRRIAPEAVHVLDEESAQATPPFSGGTHTTVVHGIVVVPDNPTPEHIAFAADLVEDLVQDTVRALHHVTGRGYVLPSLEADQFGVALGLDEIAPDGGLVARWNLGVHIPRSSRIAFDDGLIEVDQGLLAHSQQEAFVRTAQTAVLDLQREAVAAGRRNADPRTAVVMAAATCESWTGLILAAMMWEDGATPEEAARDLGRPLTAKQRISELGQRLRGSWDYRRVPALIAWDVDVRAARNRVLHAAGLPSLNVGDRALNAMYELIDLTLDRLCSGPVRNRYPMTALLMARENDLIKRRAWTRKLQTITADVRRLDLLDAFERWYAAVQVLQLPPAMRPEPDPAAPLDLVQLLDGRIYWVQYDRPTRLARLVHPSGPLVEAAIARANRSSTPVPGRTVSFEEAIAFEAAGKWELEHNLIPGSAVLSDPDLWGSPPLAPNLD